MLQIFQQPKPDNYQDSKAYLGMFRPVAADYWLTLNAGGPSQ